MKNSSVAHQSHVNKSLPYTILKQLLSKILCSLISHTQCVFPGVAVNIIFGILREIWCLGGRASVFSRATERQLPKLMAERTPFIF